jgi:hypothetical protein
MDKKEFSVIATGIKAAYPASKILEDNASMDFWYKMLADIPYKVAENAIMEHISTNVYPPNIAQIRSLCVERCSPAIPGFDEAWGTVQKAMAKYGYYNTQEAFETMDELTLSIVKNLGWSRLCQSDNQTADRANFREAYEAKVKELQKSRQLPEFVAKSKELIKEQYVPAIEAGTAPGIEAREDLQNGKA